MKRLLLIAVAVWMAAAPWPRGAPHLVTQASEVLKDGGAELRAIDVFDLMFHAVWAAVLVAMIVRWLRQPTSARS